jgi:hypothetical protein
LLLYKTVPFYDNWLDVSGMKEGSGVDHPCRLDPSFFDIFDHMTASKKKQWRIEAAQRCHETLGPYPALCFSGGIDSQAMLHCFAEADLEAHVIIFTFKDDLNKQDSNHAKMYCLEHDIPYREIEFDIVSFLTRDNLEMTRKYGNISPHFNTHYRFVEILTHMGYTGVCFGGQTPHRNLGSYGFNLNRVVMHWSVIGDRFQIANQGSFLSFSPELTWATTLLTPSLDDPDCVDNDSIGNAKLRDYKLYKEFQHERYKTKIKGYESMGFSIIPQETKFTGFELVKDHFEKLSGDGWEFEKKFRYPLSRIDGGKFNKDWHSYKIALTVEQQQKLESIYLKKFTPGP